MIPKKIHYCWFGENPLDELSLRCIASWEKFFPDYEIVCWNESNFDITQIPFMQEAYHEKKWAFVSDVARLIVLYQHGGIYFDTDVEVIKPFDDILNKANCGFFGFEVTGFVASGLGFAAEKGDSFLQQLITKYKGICFADYKDRLSEVACPIIMTQLMEEQGFVRKDALQSFRGFDIYPTEYFSPLDYDTGKLRLTKNTHSVHWGNASWNDEDVRKSRKQIQRYRRLFGRALGEKLFGITSCIKTEGFLNYIKRHFT